MEMRYSEDAFDYLCTSGKIDLYCLPTFMIVLEFIRFLDSQGNHVMSLSDIKALFDKADMTEPMYEKKIRPSEKTIARAIKKLVEKNWLSVLDEPEGRLRVDSITFGRDP